MITRFKKEDLKKLLDGEEYANEFNLIADKLRVIYTVFGWTHMTEDFSKPDENIEDLLKYIYQTLIDNPKGDPQVGSAGLTISGYLDEEDFLNLDFYFNLS